MWERLRTKKRQDEITKAIYDKVAHWIHYSADLTTELGESSWPAVLHLDNYEFHLHKKGILWLTMLEI